MKKPHGLHLLLLLVLLLGGLFGLPIQGQGVSAAPFSTLSEYIDFTVLNAPQPRMCLGNTAYFSIQYEVSANYTGTGKNPGLTPIPVAGRFGLTATATNGTVSPTATWLYSLTGSGTVPATFKADKVAGTAKIVISIARSGIPGVTKTISFKVVKCTWKVMIEADERNVENPIKQFIKFQGEGGINVTMSSTAGTGTLEGDGTYRYTMTYQYVNKDPNLKCQDFSISSGDSTFSITNGSILANAVAFRIRLATVDMPASIAKCEDSSGHKVEVEANKAMTITDPNIPEFESLVFPDGKSYLPFAFGDGKAGVYLVQRKGR